MEVERFAEVLQAKAVAGTCLLGGQRNSQGGGAAVGLPGSPVARSHLQGELELDGSPGVSMALTRKLPLGVMLNSLDVMPTGIPPDG